MYWFDEVTNLHMSQKLGCHGMSKIVTLYDHCFFILESDVGLQK